MCFLQEPLRSVYAFARFPTLDHIPWRMHHILWYMPSRQYHTGLMKYDIVYESSNMKLFYHIKGKR